MSQKEILGKNDHCNICNYIFNNYTITQWVYLPNHKDDTVLICTKCLLDYYVICQKCNGYKIKNYPCYNKVDMYYRDDGRCFMKR